MGWGWQWHGAMQGGLAEDKCHELRAPFPLYSPCSSAFRGLNAHERHTMLISDYMRFYGGSQKVAEAGGLEALVSVLPSCTLPIFLGLPCPDIP